MLVRLPEAQSRIREFYSALYKTWGRQHWWPAESAWEVIVGSFLTQNTAWTNVERAINNLRAADALSIEAMRALPLASLEQLIRPAGYFRQKASRLKTFIHHLDQHYAGSVDRLFSRPTNELRAELLSLNGIGPETADSILLYAGQHEVFVVDAYTRRILERHGILSAIAKYEDIRAAFEAAFPPGTGFDEPALEHHHKPPGAHHPPSAMSEAPRSPRAQIFNEFHGLIVGVGKNYCQSRRVSCEDCPLGRFLHSPIRLKMKQRSK
ncbi:MAG TPA: hypothetical protein VN577_00505 [Terriglobales bacterium]|nr:hypothetical protein [Terriglobales bacterium]